jgi:hypothetical protein
LGILTEQGEGSYITEPHCLYGNEERTIYLDGGPPVRRDGKPVSGNEAVDAARLQRSERYTATVEFVEEFRKGGMQGVELCGNHRVDGVGRPKFDFHNRQ